MLYTVFVGESIPSAERATLSVFGSAAVTRSTATGPKFFTVFLKNAIS